MKKLLYSLVTLIMIMAASCNSQKPLATTVDGGNPLSFSTEGKILTANLVGNSTTGYTWQCEIKDNKKLTKTTDEYKVPQREDGQVILGKPGVHTFVFEAKSQGKTKIVFDYAQHWNKGNVGGYRTLIVNIDEQLNISAVEEE